METQFIIITILGGILITALFALTIIYVIKYKRSMYLTTIFENKYKDTLIDSETIIGDHKKLDNELNLCIKNNRYKTEKNDKLVIRVSTLKAQVEEALKLIETGREVHKEFADKNRTLKGNVTRFKNRDLYNKDLLNAYNQKLADLGIKFLEKIVDTENGENEYVFTKIIKEAIAETGSSETTSVTSLCNCMSPVMGLGGFCKKCRKKIKKNV